MKKASTIRNQQKKRFNAYIKGMLKIVENRVEEVSSTSQLDFTAIHMGHFEEVAKSVYPQMLSGGKLLYFWMVTNTLKDLGYKTDIHNDCLRVYWKAEETLK